MFLLHKKSHSGLEMNPIVAAVMIAVGLLAAGAVTLMIVPMINKTKDQQIIENLAALKGAINNYMVNSNGEAPCFDPNLTEGTTTVPNNSLCDQGDRDYNYEQGVSGSGADLDKDGKTGEKMTPFAMLVPKYLDRMPSPAYAGEAYFYTKGVNVNNNTTPAFAVSRLLHSDIADETIKKNVSVLDAISNASGSGGTTGVVSVAFTNSSTNKACRSSDLKGRGKFDNRVSDVNGLSVGELGGWKYYGVRALNADTIKPADQKCDIYSDGNVFQDAFGRNVGQSPSITINETN